MYESMIKKSGISMTQKRISLLRSLNALKKPVTIEFLSKHLDEKMDTSTIYRSLRVLVDAGLVYQTDFQEGVSYYEFQGENHHHHITCTQCKKRDSIDFCPKESLSELADKKSYHITHHIFELFGVCKNCLS
jgi:Fe2+ or Zn2+ uptake regulation protein